jgi:chromosome segregation ATPase
VIGGTVAAALASMIAAAGTQAPHVDVTSIIVAIVAAIGGAGGTALLTRKATNKRLEAEGAKFWQEALEMAEDRHGKAIVRIENIRKIIEERLDATERELTKTRGQLETAESKIRELQAQVEAGHQERQAILERAQRERDALKRRVEELERVTVDLEARAEPSRRRNDKRHHPTDL